MTMRRNLMRATAAAAAALALTLAPVFAQGVIKIGEVNSYKAQPAFLKPYKKGMELAVDEINAAGGVNGKKIELITRDDNANPGDAVRVAEELVSRERSMCWRAPSCRTPAWRWPTSPSRRSFSSLLASR